MLCAEASKQMCRRSGKMAETTNLVLPRRPKRRRRVQGFRRRIQIFHRRRGNAADATSYHAQWHPSYRQVTGDRTPQCEDRNRQWQVALGQGQTWDWEIQLQWRASTGSVLWVQINCDEHHVQAEVWTQDHLDASSFQTLADDRLHHHDVSG